MNRTRLRTGGVVLAGILTAGAASSSVGDGGGFLNAEVRVADAGESLDDRIRDLLAATDEPRWVAWSVPSVDPTQSVCCFDDWAVRRSPGLCSLESRNALSGQQRRDAPSGGDLRILLRLAAGAVDRVRAYSIGCRLDAGGRTVTVLEGVRPEASVRLLEALVVADGGRRLGDDTMMAIAGHADPAADEALERFAHRDSPRRFREKSAFWSGAARGERGLTLLRRMLRQERDPDVLEQVVFGISLSEGADAGDVLIETARNDGRPGVRKQALFWLAQRAGQRVVEALVRAVEDDPDAEVREHAVFALSQLSGGRGVPRLIELARTHRHPEVRQKAVFWLGQSGDLRALDLFEEILGN